MQICNSMWQFVNTIYNYFSDFLSDVCIQTHTHTHTNTHTHTHTHTQTQMHTNTYIYTYTYLHIQGCLSGRMVISAIGSNPSNGLKPNLWGQKGFNPLCQCVYVYVCIVNSDIQTIHRCSHTSIHTHTHTYTHAQTHTYRELVPTWN